ncbi:MAG: putative membrane-anchored protein [Limisphaerales bacterium]
MAKAHEGRTPSRETLARAGVMMRQKAEINTMVRDGKLFYEMRLLGEAKSKLKQAIKMDPSHRAAYYYLSLIQEAQYGDAARKRDLMQKERLVDVEREWNEFLK